MSNKSDWFGTDQIEPLFFSFFSTSLFKSWHFCYEFFWGPYCGILRSFVSLKHSIRNFGAFNLGWFSGRSTHHWLSLRIWNSNQWFNSNHYHSVHTFTKIFVFSKREMKISQFRPPFFEQFSLGFSCCIQFWRKFQSRSRSQERDCCINLLLSLKASFTVETNSGYELPNQWWPSSFRDYSKYP